MTNGLLCQKASNMEGVLALQWRHNECDAQIQESIKAPRDRPLCGDFIGYRWIPRTQGQYHGKSFHLMTPSCEKVIHRTAKRMESHWCSGYQETASTPNRDRGFELPGVVDHPFLWYRSEYTLPLFDIYCDNWHIRFELNQWCHPYLKNEGCYDLILPPSIFHLRDVREQIWRFQTLLFSPLKDQPVITSS